MKSLEISTDLSTLKIRKVGKDVHMLSSDMGRHVLTVLKGKDLLAIKNYFNLMHINEDIVRQN